MKLIIFTRFLSAALVLFAYVSITAQTIASSAQSFDVVNSNTQAEKTKRLVRSILPQYYSQTNGISLEEIIDRALNQNGLIKLGQLEIAKAKARLRQSALRKNPTLQIEQKTGVLVGDPKDGQLTIGFSIPLDIYKERKLRIESSQAEIILKEAEIDVIKRNIISQILTHYSQALAAITQLKATEELLKIDIRTTRYVQIRVNEGESSYLS